MNLGEKGERIARMSDHGWLRFLRFWFPVILYSGMIYWVSDLPSLAPPLKWKYADKLFHILEYIPFGLLLTRAMNYTHQGLSPGKVLWLVLLGSLLYGISDEFHQSFVEGRSSGMDDVVADTTGSVIGCLSFLFLRHRLRKKV